MEVASLIEELRKKQTPTKTSDVPNNFVELLRGLLGAAQIKAEVMLGGSYAKGTYLEGDHDIDVFVRFDEQYKDEEMADLLGLALGGWEGLQRVHGSRDYFQLEKEGFSFEIVPVLKVDNPKNARNITDVSPLTVQHVKNAIKDNPVLANDIRLAKRFCKAAKVYGAESYMNGFSGHVIDNLIIYYGSFVQFLDAASSWPDKVFIDSTNKHKDGGFLNKAKRKGPLVLLDPIHPNRNAAAAVSKKKFIDLRSAVKEFLVAPNESFFTVIPLTEKVIREQFSNNPVLIYELLPVMGSKDVAGTKLFKAHSFFLREAKNAGFSVIGSDFEFSGKQALAYVAVDKEPLSETVELTGPPLSVENDVARFKEAHLGKTIEKDGRLYAVEPRSFRTLAALFSSVEKSPYFKERVVGAKVI